MDRFVEADMFVKTVEAGTITAAADRLSLDKSVVSRRIKALENRLGAQLLNRSTRTLALTEAGRQFYDRATVLLADWREMEDETSGADCALAGQIRLAAPLSFGLSQLGPQLIRFTDQNPDIQLDVDFSDRKVDLISEGFDLAVRIGRLDDSALIARKLGDVKIVAAASPQWVETYGPIDGPDDLTDKDELVFGLRDRKGWDYHMPDGGRGTIRTQPRMRASNGDFLREAAIAGQGVVFEPDFILCDAIRDGRLVQLVPDVRFNSPSVYTVWPPTRHVSRRVRALIDYLIEAFSGVPPWSLDANRDEMG